MTQEVITISNVVPKEQWDIPRVQEWVTNDCLEYLMRTAIGKGYAFKLADVYHSSEVLHPAEFGELSLRVIFAVFVTK